MHPPLFRSGLPSVSLCLKPHLLGVIKSLNQSPILAKLSEYKNLEIPE